MSCSARNATGSSTVVEGRVTPPFSGRRTDEVDAVEQTGYGAERGERPRQARRDNAKERANLRSETGCASARNRDAKHRVRRPKRSSSACGRARTGTSRSDRAAPSQCARVEFGRAARAILRAWMATACYSRMPARISADPQEPNEEKHSGSPLEVARGAGIRAAGPTELIEPPYRLIYRVHAETIEVIAVVHARQQLRALP